MKNSKELYTSMFTSYPDVVNVKEMIEMLGGISQTLAYRILKKNEIKSIKIGREYKIPKVNIISYIIQDNLFT